jgi:hypothetical protein
MVNKFWIKRRCLKKKFTPLEVCPRVQMPNPVPADYARDYKPLEKLNLEKYVVLE